MRQTLNQATSDPDVMMLFGNALSTLQQQGEHHTGQCCVSILGADLCGTLHPQSNSRRTPYHLCRLVWRPAHPKLFKEDRYHVCRLVWHSSPSELLKEEPLSILQTSGAIASTGIAIDVASKVCSP